MKTVLLVAAGVVLGVLVLGVLLLGFLRKKFGSLANAITQLVQAGGIPPFRIHLDALDAPEWRDAEGMEAATGHFEDVGYHTVGDFDIREMDEVRIRALCHRDAGTCVALYDHPEAALCADAFQEFVDGTTVTVSTAPDTGVDRPMHSKLFRLEADVRDEGVARQLHDQLVHESIGLEPTGFGPDEFADVYTEHYAQEMDWRIARGGVTRGEIERIAELSSSPPPNDATIEMIQQMWRCAIAAFIDDEVRNAWLADCGLSALEWERIQHRITVVHDHHEVDELVDQLAWTIVETEADSDADYDDEAACERARDLLRSCFDSSVRDGFARAQALLPEKRQYEKLGSTEDPWPADVWAEPEGED